MLIWFGSESHFENGIKEWIIEVMSFFKRTDNDNISCTWKCFCLCIMYLSFSAQFFKPDVKITLLLFPIFVYRNDRCTVDSSTEFNYHKSRFVDYLFVEIFDFSRKSAPKLQNLIFNFWPFSCYFWIYIFKYFFYKYKFLFIFWRFWCLCVFKNYEDETLTYLVYF